ncbi:hypothetical protein GCM10011586_30210 [Silvibacterium dinghuense]|nr:hypothetical protein GCM10011586_30210 [Silvibacterium dinghuense]
MDADDAMTVPLFPPAAGLTGVRRDRYDGIPQDTRNAVLTMNGAPAALKERGERRNLL